jgi:hypothetical protein
MDVFWNNLNQLVHRIFIGGIVDWVNNFAKTGHVQVMTIVSEKLHHLGLTSSTSPNQAKSKISKRAKLGLHPIGLTAVAALLFVGAFLFIASR